MSPPARVARKSEAKRWNGRRQTPSVCPPGMPHAYQHEVGKTVYLYRFDDKPMITALGFYRSAEDNTERLISD
ncbi:hypothetical protein GB937_009758 [Aspergillus fischeri]|nr:hypothetical protein GB937_009758 [Aspergillus fischeri]